MSAFLIAADNDNMNGLNDIYENKRKKRYDDSPVDENVSWYDLFRDVGTQVEENDILRESKLLEKRIILDNFPPSSTICATGVAETAIFGNCGQIFGTAKLNTEPRLTFMLPSIRSAFDENVTQSTPGSTSMNDQHETFGVSVVEPSRNLPSFSFPPMTSLSVMSPQGTSQPFTTLASSMSSTVTSVTMTSSRDTTVTVTFPQMTSATTSNSEQMTSPLVTSQLVTFTNISKLAEMTSKSMTSAKVTFDSTESPNKMSTGSTSSPTMARPLTSSPMTSDALMTLPLFFPLPTTNVFDTSKKRLSSKLSDDSRSRSRGLSPRRSPIPCNEQEPLSRSPSPLHRNLRTRVNIDTPCQSREQTRDITSVNEKQTLARVPESMVRSSTKKATVEETTQEQSTAGKGTFEESVMEQYSSPEKTTSEQSTRELLTSKQSIPEKRTPVLLTGSLVYTPEYVPLLTTLESSAPQTAENGKPVLEASKTSSSSLEKSTTGFETGKTDSSSVVMIASTSSAGSSGNEQANPSVSGKKRRRTGARSFGKGKRKKSRTVMDKTGDVIELKDRLPQRGRSRSSYKVKEVGDIDTNPELSRRVSHAASLGRVSPNLNTRLRSRNGSKASNVSSTDVIACDNVATTSDVINNVVTSNSDITSANDVISKQPSEAGGSEMAML